MGYNTNHALEFQDMATGKKPKIEVYRRIIADLRKIHEALYSWKKMMHVEFWGEGVKWFEHDKDFTFLSIKYPDVLFTLHGSGEGLGDIWRKFYWNGEMSGGKAEIIYPVCPWVKGVSK